jgi:hypothetical protein
MEVNALKIAGVDYGEGTTTVGNKYRCRKHHRGMRSATGDGSVLLPAPSIQNIG